MYVCVCRLGLRFDSTLGRNKARRGVGGTYSAHIYIYYELRHVHGAQAEPAARQAREYLCVTLIITSVGFQSKRFSRSRANIHGLGVLQVWLALLRHAGARNICARNRYYPPLCVPCSDPSETRQS